MGAGDSFITSFMVSYLDCVKKGMGEEEALTGSLKRAARFASGIRGISGAFGYGKECE